MTITLTREEAQQVLYGLEKAIELSYSEHANESYFTPAIETLRARLAQPELSQRTGDCLLTGVCATEGHRIQKAQREPEQVTQAMRLYKAVERLALQAGEEPDETVEWLCGEHGGMFKLYDAYFSPEDTAPVQRKWQNVTDAQLIDEVRNRGFDIRDATIGSKWQGLTDEENFSASYTEGSFYDGWRRAEAKLKAKNA